MAGFHLDNMMIEHKPVFIPYVMIIESDAELGTMLQQRLNWPRVDYDHSVSKIFPIH